MIVSWNRFKSAPAGRGEVVKVFHRDEDTLAEIQVDFDLSDPEWKNINIPIVILPVETCTPVKE